MLYPDLGIVCEDHSTLDCVLKFTDIAVYPGLGVSLFQHILK